MSTVTEIQSALKDLPLEDAQSLATWLQRYLEGQAPLDRASAIPGPQRLPDYAARRRAILGDKVLPNLVLMGRAEERW